MANIGDGKKSFWKRGNDTKLPGRYYKKRVLISAYFLPFARPQPVARSPDVRPRSKTFEEYEKDTDDAWDEEPGDISHLTSPAAQLEFDHSGEVDVKISGKSKCRHVTIQ